MLNNKTNNADVYIKPIIDKLFRYGFDLSPGTYYSNKSGSIYMQAGPAISSIYPTGNINLLLNNVTVGHFSQHTGKFVYRGGNTLVEAFPPKRIKQVFSDTLRRFLDSDKEEYVANEVVKIRDYRDFDFSELHSLVTIFRNWTLLDIFDIDAIAFDLDYFKASYKKDTGLLIVTHSKSKEPLFTIDPVSNMLNIFSNRVSELIILKLMEEIDQCIARTLGDITRDIVEPPMWEWVDQTTGTRKITAEWLRWKMFSVNKKPMCDSADYYIRENAIEVAKQLPKAEGTETLPRRVELDRFTGHFKVFYDQPVVIM